MYISAIHRSEPSRAPMLCTRAWFTEIVFIKVCVGGAQETPLLMKIRPTEVESGSDFSSLSEYY